MKNLINRTHSQAFGPLFQQAAEEMSSKLPFTSREEYLAWVSQWKEDYRLLSNLRRHEKLGERLRSAGISETKASRLQAQVDGIMSAETKAKAVERTNALAEQMKAHCGAWYCHSVNYRVCLYLLVARKASKLRSAVLRKARLAAQGVGSEM